MFIAVVTTNPHVICCSAYTLEELRNSYGVKHFDLAIKVGAITVFETKVKPVSKKILQSFAKPKPILIN